MRTRGIPDGAARILEADSRSRRRSEKTLELVGATAVEQLAIQREPYSEISHRCLRDLAYDKRRREGHAHLQELYLTDETLDGSKVASLILQLPQVAGVVIMLSDGAVLGGGLSGGLSEGMLSRAPDFVKHLLGFTQGIQGGPPSFATFSNDAFQVSLTIGGDVFILSAHEGRRLPPGLRERLVATARAVNMIYGPQS
jgi:hypothetical protein